MISHFLLWTAPLHVTCNVYIYFEDKLVLFFVMNCMLIATFLFSSRILKKKKKIIHIDLGTFIYGTTCGEVFSKLQHSVLKKRYSLLGTIWDFIWKQTNYGKAMRKILTNKYLKKVWFDDSKITFVPALRLIYSWPKELPLTKCKKEQLYLSSKTVID